MYSLSTVARAEPVEEVEEEEKEEKETPTPLAPTPSDTFNDVSEADLQNNATVQQSASDLEETSLSHSQVRQWSEGFSARHLVYSEFICSILEYDGRRLDDWR